MASTYSTNLGIELIGTGDQSGTWGATTNTNLGTLLEQAIVGYSTQAVTDGASPTVLSITNGTSSTGRNYVIALTGTLTANRTVEVPAVNKPYIFFNSTTGGFAVTVKVSGQTGVTIANGKKAIVYTNTTDVIEVANAPATEAGTQTLTNKTLTAPVIATIVNTGTLTLPTSTDTLVGRATTDTLTNKTLTAPVIATIVNTGTLTLPTSTDTLVGRATTDTLTNKTLTSPLIGTVIGGTTASSSLTLQSTSGVGTTDNILFKVGNNGATTAMTIDTSGNIGVGTSTINSRLSFGTSAGFKGIYLYDDGTGASGFGITSNTLNVYSGGTTIAFGTAQTSGSSSLVSEAMRIVSGNVGIGTASPNNSLTVSRAGADVARFVNSGSNGGDWQLKIGGGGFEDRKFMVTDRYSGADNVRMAIDSSGNVGIGTTSPGTQLNVYKSTATQVAIRPQNSLAYADFGPISDGTIYGPYAAPAASTSLVIGTSNSNPVTFWTNGSERMRIDSSGNVGIGTTSMASASLLTVSQGVTVSNAGTPYFQVYNTSAGTNQKYWRHGNNSGSYIFETVNDAYSSSTERMRIDSSGNVGIGTSSPSYLLHLSQNGDTQAWISATNAGTNSAGISLENVGQRNWQVWASRTRDALVFGNNSRATVNMALDAAGNVNLGSENPATSALRYFDIYNTSTTTTTDGAILRLITADVPRTGTSSVDIYKRNNGQFTIQQNDTSAAAFMSFAVNGERMRIDSSGNVGIGTASPSASAILDAQSTTKGVRFPNMTTTQKNAVSSPAAGLVVFDTTLAKLCVYSGSAWQTITSV